MLRQPRAVTAFLFLFACFLLVMFGTKSTIVQAAGGKSYGPLTGKWEISETKEPGKPYRKGYKGRPFVSKGPNAYTIEVHYNPDGTFKRISRIGQKEIVSTGKWTLQGHELRQAQKGSDEEEIIYIRFDGPNQYTSIEVFEETTDPGTFARYKRID